jgi:hypothetical protein
MKRIIIYLTIVSLSAGLNGPVYAQLNKDFCKQNTTDSVSLDKSVGDYLKGTRYDSAPPQKKGFSIMELFKSKAFATPVDSDGDRKKIREEWKEFLGLDVFYPYFKAKDIEAYVQKKSTVKFFNLRGRPEFSNKSKEVKYIFKKRF